MCASRATGCWPHLEVVYGRVFGHHLAKAKDDYKDAVKVEARKPGIDRFHAYAPFGPPIIARFWRDEGGRGGMEGGALGIIQPQ